MRQLYFVLLILVLGAVSAIAQPTIAIGDETACTGESFCVPFTVDDFTNITALEFTIEYDPAVLRWDNAANFNVDLVNNGGLGVGNFVEDTPGEIRFTGWNTGDCASTSNLGITLADELKIFDLCFTAIGTYGDRTDIAIAEDPTPQCFRNSTRCFNIGLLTESSTITLCVREFVTSATAVSGNEGDQVCMIFEVEGFDDISGIQYTINYDPSFLQFESLQPNFEVPQNGLASVYGLPGQIAAGPGNITVSWSYNIPGEEDGATVPDGTEMYRVCFTILGDCENSTLVTFGNEPTPQEVNNTDPDNPDEQLDVPFRFEPALVTVNECNPDGVQIIVDCPPDSVNVGDIISVPILAGTNFVGIRELAYLMSWNDAVLQYIDVSDPDNLAGLDPGDFDESNAGSGILGLNWDFPNPGQSLNNNEVIYVLRFRVVGLGGDAPIQILTPGRGVQSGVNIGIAPTNCAVEVIQPQSVGIDFGDLSVPLNETDCLPVSVSNFNEVTSLAFTANWDESLWQFTQITNINPLLTGAGPANFTPIGLSSVIFDWDNASPVTLPDETVIFEMCFQTTPTALPGDCSEMITVGFPVGEEAVTASSNDENVGLIVNPSTMCILFPEGFGLTAGTVNVGWRDTICVPFTIESFDNITAADFSVVWDPEDLQFISATALNWPGLVLNAPNPVGTVNASFSSASPLAIPDGEVAFEVCFQAIGDPEACYDLEIANNPLPVVETTNGDGSIVITNGEVCVEEQIVVESLIITPTSCPGSCDGAVEITVYEWAGQGFIGTVWETEPIRQNTPLMVDDICEGELIFTIFDNRTGATLTDTIMIPTSGSSPTVEIRGPEEVELPCDGGLVPLNVDNPDGDNTYNWYFNTLNGAPAFTNRVSVLVDDPGNYIAEAVNANGCTGVDTVTVVIAEGVTANAGEVPTPGITCTNASVTLNGSGSGADNLTYMWEPIPAGRPIDTMTMNTPNLVVTTPGQYRLNVTDPVTGCTASDIVAVGDDRVFPNACLDPESVTGDASAEQDCNGGDSTFDASCSTNDGLMVTYTWYDTAGNEAGSGLTFGANVLGTYELVVTENTTGCTDTAFATIVPNTSAPMVTIDPAPAIDCNRDTVVLNASVTPSIPNLTISWTTTGGQLRAGTEDSLMPTALVAGEYQVLVTNTDNNCEGGATVIIADSTAAPLATISNSPEELVISCANNSVLLDGSASGVGAHLSYQWYVQAEPDLVAPNGTTDSLRVNEANSYILEVTNTNTGCSSRDTVTVSENFETLRLIPNSLEPFVLTCEVDTALLGITVEKQVGEDFVPAVRNVDYQILGWTPPAGITNYAADSLTVTVNTMGIYNVEIVSLNSGCTSDADFEVLVDRQDPTINVSNDTLSLNCANTEVSLNGFGSSEGDDFTYRWEDSAGTIISTMLQTNVMMADEYRLFVTNVTNNCTVDSLVVVVADTIRPIATIDPVADITCADPSRMVRVNVSNVPNILVTWPDPLPDGQIISIDQTGTFMATVTNTDNGCQSTASVTIGGDIVPPPISLATLPAFDCDTESAEVNASASGSEFDFSSITWTSADGSPITEMMGNRLIATVVDTGTYQLSLVSAANGCSADTVFTISAVANPTAPPIQVVEPIAEFGCDGTLVTIDISPTGDLADFTDLSWTSLNSGNTVDTTNPLVVNVDGAGEYAVAITYPGALACVAQDTITVNPDQETPVADAGPDQTLDCGDVGNLDGSNSSTGPNFVYNWLPQGDSPALSGDVDGPTPTITEAGSYILLVTNTNNGCVDSSGLVMVELILPDPADAGSDQVVCDDLADLNAVAVMGTQGSWSTSGGAIIDFVNDPATSVTALAEGPNVFVWTQTAPDCPQYNSTDEVLITRSTAPEAFDDVLTVEQGTGPITINLTGNDNRNGASELSVRLLSEPENGTYDTLALAGGSFVFTPELLYVGPVTATYEICSVDCPDLCATANIEISILPPGEGFTIPNAITPNNDGSNDNFVFDLLRFTDPEEFPDNELIIFNRWGDIIYEAKPYNNDWNGTNEQGNPIPEGTYYYILRLNISEGDILRGDITIIR